MDAAGPAEGVVDVVLVETVYGFIISAFLRWN